MSRYYFTDELEGNCYTLDYFKEQLNEDNNEITLFEAEMETGESYFYCSLFGEIGEVGEGCGRQCSKYKPRNGKNGRCRHSNNAYYTTGKSITIKFNPKQ